MSDKTSLSDRMKSSYEDRGRHYLTRRIPVIVRVDGRAFHTLTRKANKPFDMNFISTMAQAATCLARDMQGFKAGFIQSDEASFLLMDDDTHTTEAWFDYNLQKVVSISAAVMSVNFNRLMSYHPEFCGGPVPAKNSPVFDARAFNIPREEVANYFLWRAKDWNLNSVQMLARSRYSQNELNGLGREDMLTKLEADGVRWNELPAVVKNGSWLCLGGEGRDRGAILTNNVRPEYAEVDTFIKACITKPEEV